MPTDPRFDNVFLVGPMGAGKTTIGRRLADARGLPFIDSDQVIEARTGVDISYIFEKEGEAGFRRRERAVIEELTQSKGIVLATGGGAIIDAGSRRVLRDRGCVVYLHASIAHQFDRTGRGENRPLLANGDRREILQRLFDERDGLYREAADLVLSTDGQAARTLVRDILNYLNGSPPA